MVFTIHNLLRDPLFLRLDLIICRNLLSLRALAERRSMTCRLEIKCRGLHYAACQLM